MFSTCSSLQQKDGVGCWCSRCLKNKREGKKTTSSNWVTGRKSNNSPLSSLWTNGFRRLRRDLGGEFLCARRRVGCSRCLCFIESIDHCFNLMPPFPFSPCLSVSCLTLLLIRDARTQTHTHTRTNRHTYRKANTLQVHTYTGNIVLKRKLTGCRYWGAGGSGDVCRRGITTLNLSCVGTRTISAFFLLHVRFVL